ncbi:enoyl-CoA hydratase [marine gamma proteobacterium HTCC2143]|jgi:2-(1,2-epoxy-1,2-dihydrophenyl)acetyl-CoA isomerase|uniref:Enoyl-CoA hydratase n=1 Tax=marine gamma proteobacterium HTCC2143 TaxID=247633 RepID=A0YA90_9GAMM|nr:enoyl-CoA hydratase [marine gamma proteobacterium HTCC2143]
MSEDLIEKFEDGVATLIMNRPHARNAMSGGMMSALAEAVPRLANDPKVRLVVLTGAGGAFCAGGDVKGFAADAGSDAAKPRTVDELAANLREGTKISELFNEMPKPTLAIIPGACAGAGLSLALSCDLRMVVDDAKITTAFSKIAASGDYGGSWFMTQLLGAAKARELYFTADVILGSEAYRLGLANKLVSAENLEEETRAYTQYLANLPTIAIGYMKKNLNMAQQGSLAQVLDLECGHMVRSMTTQDHKSAAVAFVEKRAPEFKGR